MPENAIHKGGRGKCATCSHPAQEEINAHLITGDWPVTKIAKHYGINESSLRAHKKNHISPAYKAVQEAKAKADGRAAIDQVKELIPILKNLLEQAQGRQDANGNFLTLPNVGQALSAVRELRATIELLARITGELDERPTTVINILTTEAWLQTRRAIMEALQPYPDARLAVASRLMLQEGKVEQSQPNQASAGNDGGGN